MADHVYIIGCHSTLFGKRHDDSFRDLVSETVHGAVADAGLASGGDVETIWFGYTGTGGWPASVTFGQICLLPLQQEAFLSPGLPVFNVENACATGSSAFYGAMRDIQSGLTGLALAVGVEKTSNPYLTHEEVIASFGGGERPRGGTHLHYVEELERAYKYAEAVAVDDQPHDGPRSVFMETYATQARLHMAQHGSTVRQFAASASKNHNMGALNPKAQYRFEMSIDEVLNDRPVAYPLTRAMCAPIGDGAAASLLCSQRFLDRLPEAVRKRAVRVSACAFSSGTFRALDQAGLSRRAAKRAYDQAGLTPRNIDVVELHDASSFCEIYQVEMLGFCESGDGGTFVEAGKTAQTGTIPVNMSGGLVSKGHPIGATGLSMIDELVIQLRGEAGPRQVEGARVGLQQNGGGVFGLEEAACSVMILERNI